MPYQPDLRNDSWMGYKGHGSARPHDPEQTREFNRAHDEAELAKAKKSREDEARRKLKAVV